MSGFGTSETCEVSHRTSAPERKPAINRGREARLRLTGYQTLGPSIQSKSFSTSADSVDQKKDFAISRKCVRGHATLIKHRMPQLGDALVDENADLVRHLSRLRIDDLHGHQLCLEILQHIL
jgi:hypothetical protein